MPITPVPYSIYIVEEDNLIFKIYPVNGEGEYLEATVSNLGVNSITGDGIDNSDPNNPIFNFPNADEIGDADTTKKFISQTDKNKLDTIEQGATQNDEDDSLRDRNTHTGTQAVSTVTGLQGLLDSKVTQTDFDNQTHIKSDITDFNDNDYATSAQGVLADSSIQSGDNISELTNDSGYITNFTEQNDLSDNVTWDIVPDDFISEGSVTQHQSAINITEAQITDLSHFTPTTLLADYSFTDNSSDWDTAFGWGNWATGVDKTFIDSLNIDSDTLDGEEGDYYLDYGNFNNIPVLAYRTVSSNTTLLETDDTLDVDTDGVTITLFDITQTVENKVYNISNSSGGNITIDTTSSQTIYVPGGGVASIVLLDGESLTVQRTSNYWRSL